VGDVGEEGARQERARLFVALDLPDAVREALLAWRAPLLAARHDVLRAVAPEALHVTLCFLGQVDAGEIAGVGEAVVEAAGSDAGQVAGGAARVGVEGGARVAGAGGLALGEALWLPRRAPRVLAVALDDAHGELGRLQGRVAGALSDGGWFSAESRPYVPHVTVARVRARGNERAARELAREPLPEVPALAFDGAAVTLYRSHLGGAGARYEALVRVELR
jgi:2'-5' RNA ligase